jgi:hypothetical protein
MFLLNLVQVLYLHVQDREACFFRGCRNVYILVLKTCLLL